MGESKRSYHPLWGASFVGFRWGLARLAPLDFPELELHVDSRSRLCFFSSGGGKCVVLPHLNNPTPPHPRPQHYPSRGSHASREHPAHWPACCVADSTSASCFVNCLPRLYPLLPQQHCSPLSHGLVPLECRPLMKTLPQQRSRRRLVPSRILRFRVSPASHG